MKPIELYKFVRGNQEWTYTSGDTSINYNSDTYVPVPIGRGGIESKNELSKANLDIKIDIYDDLARLLLREINDEILSLTLFIQVGMSTNTAWKGRLSSIKPSATQLTMVFESVFTSLRRPGLRARYQKTCRHMLYGRGCTLNAEDFAVDGFATDVTANGLQITVPEAAGEDDGYYIGGMIRAPDETLRMIIGHSGSVLTLIRPLDSLTAAIVGTGYGMGYGEGYGGTVAVKIYPGCDRLRSTCKNKFNNLLNYGGFPWIPSKNPMGGSSIV